MLGDLSNQTAICNTFKCCNQVKVTALIEIINLLLYIYIYIYIYIYTRSTKLSRDKAIVVR